MFDTLQKSLTNYFSNITPESFNLLLAACLIILAIVSFIFSLFPSIRAYLSKIGAMLVIMAIALISNNGFNYFATIFIIATVITETDFLENLAAIIRGNSDYFKHKPVPMDKALSKEKDTQKLNEMGDAEKEDKDERGKKLNTSESNEKPVRQSILQLNSHGDRMKEYKRIEKKALDFAEKKYGHFILREVCVKNNSNLRFDGLFQDKNGVKDFIYEVRLVTVPRFMPSVIPHLINMVDAYQQTTKRFATMRLIIACARQIESEKLKRFTNEIHDKGLDADITFIDGSVLPEVREISI